MPSEPVPHVLVVDDEPKNLQLIGSVLNEQGYDVTVATSGQEALDIVRDTPPTLILLDVMMPGMDGYEVCRRLRRNMATASIPVIFLTALTDKDNIVQGFRAGGVDYVTKPFFAEELIARVETQVHLHQLKSLLAVCSYCNRVRTEVQGWQKLEYFIHDRAGVHFSHTICPDCYDQAMKEIQEFQADSSRTTLGDAGRQAPAPPQSGPPLAALTREAPVLSKSG